MDPKTLTAVSPIDGRYAQHTIKLQDIFSEYGLIRFRVFVEVCWLEMLIRNSQITEVPQVSTEAQTTLFNIAEQFTCEDALEIKKIEKTTNHDVKAVEYFIKAKLETHPELTHIKEFVHFACTSEDINNLAYALMIKEGLNDILLPLQHRVIDKLLNVAEAYAKQPMLSHTHGQPATPTTVGKEFANIAHRLDRQFKQIDSLVLMGKMNGAVGNCNAHRTAYPDVDWLQVNQQFIESLGLRYNPYTTQIEPHDTLAELFHALQRFNTILLDLCRDLWGYIALDYFKQKLKDGEVGSSTMPHKVNPIDFENAEGNIGLSNTLLHHFSEKLPVSRWQRDLSDSTVLRNIGTAFAHSVLAYQSTLKGLDKIEINPKAINHDLETHWAVLAEPVQMVMRRYGINQPYEQLKALTRGKSLDQKMLHAFIDGLELPDVVKVQLKQLTPSNYLGYAMELAESIRDECGISA